jgi:hypothetical protein
MTTDGRRKPGVKWRVHSARAEVILNKYKALVMLQNHKNKPKKKDKLGKANRNSTFLLSCSEIATECRQQDSS